MGILPLHLACVFVRTRDAAYIPRVSYRISQNLFRLECVVFYHFLHSYVYSYIAVYFTSKGNKSAKNDLLEGRLVRLTSAFALEDAHNMRNALDPSLNGVV